MASFINFTSSLWRHNTPQQLVLRAKIILMASDGQNHREIARSLEINRQMARLWRNRWLESEGKDLSILQKLQDQERVGAPAKFSMEQVTELFARLLFLTVRLWTNTVYLRLFDEFLKSTILR